MDLNLLFPLIGQVATWLTILLVYFTLIEMKNQRKASQKPDLIIPKSKIIGYSWGFHDEQVTEFLIPRIWSNKKLETDEHILSNSGPITLYNVGFGVAKNLRLRWLIDYSQTIEQIKDYCYQNSLPIIIQSEKNKLVITEQGAQPPSEFFVPEYEIKHDFLMPASISSEGLTSQVHPAFVELVSISIYLRVHYRRSNINSLTTVDIKIPTMTLELSYDDLENTHYSKTFDVSFSEDTYSITSSDKDWEGLHEMLTASFEFKNRSTN